jgi:hypothetical protein
MVLFWSASLDAAISIGTHASHKEDLTIGTLLNRGCKISPKAIQTCPIDMNAADCQTAISNMF